jgi:CheY-like chemotaxis protein
VRLARRDGAARLVTVALSSPPRGGGRPGGLLFAFRPQDEAPAPPPAPAAAPPPAADPADHLEGVQRVLGEAFGRFHREIILARGEAALAGHHLTNPPAAGRHLEGLRQRLEDVNGWMRSLADFFAWQAIRPQDVDLHQLLAQMGEELRGLLGPRCRLTTQVGPGPGLVRADAAGLRRLVRAAVANAGQAMPAGGTVRVETARVTVGPDQPPPPGVRLLPGPYLVLQVSDTGVGLDDRARARLFEPFFTTRAAAGGQGLNLAAAYGLAEQCNGGVAVQSALGQGTTFRFYWPLAVAPARADQGTVLLLDEDRSARRQTHQALERAGYRVLAARYAGEALRHAARPDEPIGLAVVAVPLHHHPAREVLRELRQLDPDLPVLCVSALPEELLVHLGQLDRAVPFRRRPAAPEDLLRDVQRLRVDRRPQLTVP